MAQKEAETRSDGLRIKVPQEISEIQTDIHGSKFVQKTKET